MSIEEPTGYAIDADPKPHRYLYVNLADPRVAQAALMCTEDGSVVLDAALHDIFHAAQKAKDEADATAPDVGGPTRITEPAVDLVAVSTAQPKAPPRTASKPRPVKDSPQA